MRSLPTLLATALLACAEPAHEVTIAPPVPSARPARVDPEALGELTLPLPPRTLRARALAVGGSHACLIEPEGGVRCWGAAPALGGATPAAPGIPVAVPGLRDVVELAAGQVHTLARTRSGEVWAFGGGDLGEIGDGSLLARRAPTRASVDGATGIAASGTASCARTGETLRCWGHLPSAVDGSSGAAVALPVAISVPLGERLVVGVDAGLRAVALGAGGTVWQWGLVPTAGSAAAPSTGVTALSLGGPASDLSTGESFSCAARADGVWCWGTSVFHFFGGSGDTPAAPVRIEGLPGASRIGAGSRFVCAAADGVTRCAGWGELVDPDGGIWPLSHTAAPVGELDGVTELVAGPTTVCGLVRGEVRCVGWRDGIDAPAPPS